MIEHRSKRLKRFRDQGTYAFWLLCITVWCPPLWLIAWAQWCESRAVYENERKRSADVITFPIRKRRAA